MARVAFGMSGYMDVGKAMIAVTTSPMIRDVGLIALCQGWPDSAPIAAATAELPMLIEAVEPVAAWLIPSKGDSALMVKYLLLYPAKLMRDDVWEASRKTLIRFQERLQTRLEKCEKCLEHLQPMLNLATASVFDVELL